jgi:RNA binding exosome subunit
MPFLNPKLGIDFTEYIADRTTNFIGRKWVFESIQSWLDDPKGDRFFLLTGEPGSGKTAIAARLTQFAQGAQACSEFEGGFLQAVHFCSARDSVWIDPKEFARSLALQLAQSVPQFAEALVEVSKDPGGKEIIIEVKQDIGSAIQSQVKGVVIENLTLSGISGQEAFTQVVVNPLKQIQGESFSKPLTILVDSLDEALTHDGKSTIVDLFSKLPPSLKVRFILTSRDEARVRNVIKGAKRLLLSDPEHIQQNREDVKAYVKARLGKDEVLVTQLESLELSQREKYIETITHKSDGNFLYVRFLLDAIASGQRSITDLEGLPQGLDELYYESLERVISLDPRKDWFEDYAPLMGVLLAAQESLNLKQLKAFTGQRETFINNCLNNLQQFLDKIKLQEDEYEYRIYHQSIADFLGKRSLLLDGETSENLYYLSIPEQHELIVNAYVSDGQALHTRIRSDLYFWNHFPYHLDRAGKTTELRQLLLNFSWLAAKLDATNIHALISDYSFLPDDTDLQLMQSALQLVENTLAKDKSQLSGQLLGHIVSPERSEIQALLEEAKLWKVTPWLRPFIPSLIPAGGPLLRIFSGHQEEVNSLAVTPDGKSVVSGSSDKTVKVWDLKTGIEILTFKGHKGYIRAVVATPDGKQVVSVASGYFDTILIWNFEMHQDLAEFTHQAITKANGNFGYLGAIGRAVDETIRQNQQELLREILKLSELPDTLQYLYAFFLSKIKDAVAKEKVPVEDAEGEIGFVPVWSAVYKPILGILSVALEPLTPTQIQKLGLIQAEFDYVTGAIERLQQFLDQLGNCYRLYHSTLPEFFTSPKTKEQTDYSYCYVDAIKQNQRIVNYYQAGKKTWAEVDLKKIAEDDYGRRHLAQHLVEGDRVEELHTLLSLEKDGKNAWFKVKDNEGDTADFLADVELAWTQADKAYDREPGRSIGLQCRYALIKSSINSLAGIPKELMVALVKHQYWKPAKALAYMG